MDTILKEFSIGFLLRGTLSGGFFILSLCSAMGDYPIADKEKSVPVMLVLAVFAGTTIYCCQWDLY